MARGGSDSSALLLWTGALALVGALYYVFVGPPGEEPDDGAGELIVLSWVGWMGWDGWDGEG